jgi:hypothetical protein
MVGVFKASYAVTDTNVVPLVRPGAFVDLLTEVLHCLRGGPDRSHQHADKLTDEGRQRLVRHSHLHERTIILELDRLG